MKKHRSTWLVLGAIFAIAVVFWCVMPAKEEPRYQGKTVKEWYGECALKRTGTNTGIVSLPPESPKAFKVLKTEAVPFLLHEVKKVDSKRHNRAYSWLNRLSNDRIMDDDERGDLLIMIFQDLGSDGKDAIPALTEMARSSGRGSWPFLVLINVFPDAARVAGLIK